MTSTEGDAAVPHQEEEEDEEDTDLFATDDPEPATGEDELFPSHSDGVAATAPPPHIKEEPAVSIPYRNQPPEASDPAPVSSMPAAVKIEKQEAAINSPSTIPRAGTPEGVPSLSSMETPNSQRDLIHIPRKSYVDSPFSPQKSVVSVPVGVLSSSNNHNHSTTHNPLNFGLSAEVKIPPSVDVTLLQGRLLDTLRNLPLQLINDALVEYDDAVQIKGEAIRNRGAYLYGVIKRYVNVQERAARGETAGSLPMGPDLTPAVQERLNKLVENGFCSNDEMNDKIKSKIRMLSERDALFAVDELASVERYQIRNFGSYFMGILNRYMRGEAQGAAAGGGPVKTKPNEMHKGPPQRFDDRKTDDRQYRGRSPDRDRRVNIGRDRYGEPFRRERSRDRFEHPPPPPHHHHHHHSQQQHQQQQQQQGDHNSRRFRHNDPDSFRRNNDSFVDRSRYDPRHQEPPQQQQPFMGGQQQHRQPQEPPMMGGFVNSVPPPPPRSNAMGVPGMSNYPQQPQQYNMQPNQNQPMGSQPGYQQPMPPMQQQQQQFLSPHGGPNPSFPGQGPPNLQQSYPPQQQPMMNQQQQQQQPHQYGNQPQQPPHLLNQQQQMMNQQQQPQSRPPLGGNLQPPQTSSYMGNPMQAGSFQQQQQQPGMMSAPHQHLPYQQQPMMGTQQQQQQPLQGSYPGVPPGGWQQSQAPVDILGLADKAASAVQALAANKLHVAPSYAGNVPHNMSSSLSSSYTIQQQQQPPPSSGNHYGPHGSSMNPNQYDIRQPPGPPPPHLQQQHPQQQQQHDPQQQRRPRTTANLEDLPIHVQYAIQNLMATQQVDGPLDSGMLGMIKDLPEALALAALQKFTTIDKNTMRNKTAYLAGVLRRELEKINRR